MISQNYPSPSLVTEFFYLYIGLVDLSEVSNVIAVLSPKFEDNRCHVFAFAKFMHLIDAGQFSVRPTVLAWLSRHCDCLRALG